MTDHDLAADMQSIFDSASNESLTRLDELVNLLIDDELAEPQVRELEQMLISSDDARKEYVGLMTLHAELTDYFRSSAEPRPAQTPVLGCLGGDMSMPPQMHQDAAE